MSRHESTGHLTWESARVDGRQVRYGVGGRGLPVLWIHGWGLGCHAYKRSLKRLIRMGCRVYAPALPDLGGSERMVSGYGRLEDYGAWAHTFLAAMGVDQPALVAGHSLGGAVATRLAHDYPDDVSHLVLINTVGAPVWTEAAGRARPLSDRPVWHWAASFCRDIAGSKTVVPTTRSIVEDFVPNLVRNPLGLLRTATMARRIDLLAQLAAVRTAGVPVTVISSDGDLVVTPAAFRAVCQALGVSGRLVPGGHSWLLADPEEFAGVIVEPVGAAMAARAARAGLRGDVVAFDPMRRRAASG